MQSIDTYKEDETVVVVADDIVNGASTDEGKKAKGDSFYTRLAGAQGGLHNADVAFDNICYSVTVNKKRKEILHNLTCLIPSGSLCAIMGSTGGGKSTLLDVLAGRKSAKDITGKVTIDGKPRRKEFKYQCGYVQQDDIVQGTLTVRENLLFSARLRLPKSMTDKQKQERVDNVIDELGLSKVADSIVGTELRRGISGGERKRVNVGLELVKSPSVLFLDEPTTGLDANTAQNLLELLKMLTLRGRTIILSIHQPRYSIFKKFDQLLLLSAGEFVYAGPAQKATDYFKDNLGYECEPFNNPADFFLDITNAESLERIRADEAENSDREGASPSRAASSVDAATQSAHGSSSMDKGEHKKSLADRFKESSVYEDLVIRVKNNQVEDPDDSTTAGVDRVDSTGDSGLVGYPVGFMKQTMLIARRNLMNMYRNPMAVVLQCFTEVLFGVIAGALYWQIDNGVDGLQNIIGALFFALMSSVFGNLSAVEIFIAERPIFVNERRGAYYSTEAYFVAKVGVDLIIGRLLPTFFYATVSFWMIGLNGGVSGYLVYLMILELVALVAVAVCFLISSMVSVYAVANILTTMVYVVMMIFGGLLVNLNSMPGWLSWAQYLSAFRYGFEALTGDQLQGQVFDCGEIACVTGDQYLDIQGFSPDNLWLDSGLLVVYWAVFMLLCLLQLRSMV